MRWLLIGLLVIGGLLPGTGAWAAGWGLAQLMQGMAQVKYASARFTERKTMAVLTAPLVASGTLTYAAPDMMEKITLSPAPERFVLDGQDVTMTGGDGQTHRFSLSQDPRIGGLTEGILATLAGDLPTLERLYDVQFSGGEGDWRLVLRPRDAGMAGLVSWMLIEGSGNRIDLIDTRSGNGDHSEMSVAEDVRDAR
jgi:outer membrane lipoprotein-sorting protein